MSHEIPVHLALAIDSGQSGTYNLNGGTLDVGGDVTDGAGTSTLNIDGDLHNDGTLKLTSVLFTLTGAYTGGGGMIIDPTEVQFNDVTLDPTAYFAGGPGDKIFVAGDFINNSINNTAWDTNEVYLGLNGTSTQSVLLAGTDLGASYAGFMDNFAFDTLELLAGTDVLFSGGALYIDHLVLGGGVSLALGGASKIYYRTITGDAGGDFSGQLLQLSAVPEPVTGLLLLTGLALVGWPARRRRSSSFALRP